MKSRQVIVNKDGGGVGMDINTKRYRYDYVVIRRVRRRPLRAARTVPGGRREVMDKGMLQKANDEQTDTSKKAMRGDRVVSVTRVPNGF